MGDGERRNATGVCAVCASPQLAEINADLEAGMPSATAAKKYGGISRQSFIRHRRNCLPIQAALLRDSRAKRAAVKLVGSELRRPASVFAEVVREQLDPVVEAAGDVPVVLRPSRPPTVRETHAAIHNLNVGLAEMYQKATALRGMPSERWTEIIQRGLSLEAQVGLGLQDREGPADTGAPMAVVYLADAAVLERVLSAMSGAASLEEARAAVEQLRAELDPAEHPNVAGAKGYVGFDPFDEWDAPVPPETAAPVGSGALGGQIIPPPAEPPPDAPGTALVGDGTPSESPPGEEARPPPEPERGLTVHYLPEPTEEPGAGRRDFDQRYAAAFGKRGPQEEPDLVLEASGRISGGREAPRAPDMGEMMKPENDRLWRPL